MIVKDISSDCKSSQGTHGHLLGQGDGCLTVDRCVTAIYQDVCVLARASDASMQIGYQVVRSLADFNWSDLILCLSRTCEYLGKSSNA